MKWYSKLNRKVQIAIPLIGMIIGFVCIFIGEITFISIGVVFLIISIPFIFLLDRAEKQRKAAQAAARQKNGDPEIKESDSKEYILALARKRANKVIQIGDDNVIRNRLNELKTLIMPEAERDKLRAPADTPIIQRQLVLLYETEALMQYLINKKGSSNLPTIETKHNHADVVSTTTHLFSKPTVETFGYTITGTDEKNGRVSRQTIARHIFWKDAEFAFPRPTIATLIKNENGYDVLANGQKIGSVIGEAAKHIAERYSRILLTDIVVEHDKTDRNSPYVPSLSITYYPSNIREMIPGYMYCPRGQRIRREKNSMFLDEYVAIDIETTGIEIFSNDIVEIAAVHIRNGEIIDKFSELIYSDRLTPEASAINHITPDMIKNARKSWDVLNGFSAFIGDLPLLGHNIDFDLSFICAIHPISNTFEDTCILADEYLSGGFGPLQLKDRKLPTLCNAFGVEIKDAHRALGDAIATHLCYERFKEYYTAVQIAKNQGTDINMIAFSWNRSTP